MTRLTPASQDHLRKSLVIGTKIYLCVIVLLLTIYIPLLTISLGGLYKQSVSQAQIDAAIGSNERSKPSRIGRKIHRERQRLVYHAICVFISTAVHLPPTAWKVANSRGDFLHNVTWKEVTASFVFMVSLKFTGIGGSAGLLREYVRNSLRKRLPANPIILLILNIHSHHILSDRKKRMQRAAMGSLATSKAAPIERNGLRTLFLSHSDDEDMSLHDATARTTNDGESQMLTEMVISTSLSNEEFDLGSGKLDYDNPSLPGIKIKQWSFSTIT
ncbi:hypothetical protein VP01_2822g5 [Puccinia sorghi]|uniref:Uncharacterized protein n=1 Tax=Puccinia sorghi TaxID=27349 RepID=A0A0L6V325_9BASI|nr:hypothetical protein VP01_2822g5 [Puccinia sorghi]